MMGLESKNSKLFKSETSRRLEAGPFMPEDLCE